MSLLDKIFQRNSSSEYTEAIELFETGDYTKSANLLRNVLKSGDQKAAPMAAFYLRQCLMIKNKSFLFGGNISEAIEGFKEAALRWPSFPDTRFWLAYALGLSGAWEPALKEALDALRYNGEYLEARLLCAIAYQELDEPNKSAQSLNLILETADRGKRPIDRLLAANAPYNESNIPENLINMLSDLLTESAPDKSIDSAVAICKSGDWDSGIQLMRELCEEHPTWPDYKVKLAAALFQKGQDREALSEVNKALVLNPKYRTAAHLKALILTDELKFKEAIEVIEGEPSLSENIHGHPGEELFCSYLAAVLYFLTGKYSRTVDLLSTWSDLPTVFPMASMLKAAAYDLNGKPAVALDLLLKLSEKWSGETVYMHALSSLQLRMELIGALEATLNSWESFYSGSEDSDDMLLLMSAYFNYSLGAPVPESAACQSDAWQFLYASSAVNNEEWEKVNQITKKLSKTGIHTEKLTSLIARTCLENNECIDYNIPDSVPDSVMRSKICLMHRLGHESEVNSSVIRLQELHPDDIRWFWLSPTYWLDPVRRWIS